MEISEEWKKYLTIYGLLAFIIILVIIFSKSAGFSCNDYATNFKNTFNCKIILTNKSEGIGTATLTGIDLDTKQVVNCEDDSKKVVENYEKFLIGDTIIKRKGEYTIHILRKKEKIDIPFICNDKVYHD